jgi:hypothetical protein
MFMRYHSLHFLRDCDEEIFYKIHHESVDFGIRRHMHVKMFKLRSLASGKNKECSIDLNLEFDGDRAFVVWDSLTVGKYLLKARVEIDPGLLQDGEGVGCDYFYRGELVLPRPELN